jgi:hypothetical protein
MVDKVKIGLRLVAQAEHPYLEEGLQLDALACLLGFISYGGKESFKFGVLILRFFVLGVPNVLGIIVNLTSGFVVVIPPPLDWPLGTVCPRR